MRQQLIPSLKIFAFLTLVTGVLYPLLILLIAQTGFTKQANGSLIIKEGKVLGSELIAQKTESSKHFWPRPSGVDYNPLPSGGSNLGPTSLDLKIKIEERKKAGLKEDLLFTSGSGLDPHVSPESAKAQIERVVSSLSKSPARKDALTRQVTTLVEQAIEPRQFNVFGEARVNILKLNLTLDEMMKSEKEN